MHVAKIANVLVTSAGTSTAVGVVKGLAHLDNVLIHTADVNPLSQLAIGALSQGSHFVAPPASEQRSYIDFIGALVEQNAIDFILPIHDQEIRVLFAARDQGLRLPLSALTSLSVAACTDKLEMARRCADFGIAAPKTIDFETYRTGPFFPAFAKPRRGVGSTGTSRINSLFDLNNLPAPNELVFQELCATPEITIDVLSSPHGSVAVARERVEVKAGVATKCRVWSSTEIDNLSDRVIKAFDLQGLFCFQVMTREGELVVTDINPRPGGATSMTLAAGINLYEAFISGELYGYDPGKIEKLRCAVRSLPLTFVSRYYQEHAQIEQ